MPWPSSRWSRTSPPSTPSATYLFPVSDRPPADADCDRLPLARHAHLSDPHGLWRIRTAQLTSPKVSLLLGILTIILMTQTPLPGYTEELSTQSDQALIPELELIKEEETVSIASDRKSVV